MNLEQYVRGLSEAQGTNAKKQFIQENTNADAEALLVAVYGPAVSYYVRKFGTDITGTNVITSDTIAKLSKLANRELTGIDAVDYLNSIAATLTPKSKEILAAIIARDLRCGINVSTINTALGKELIWDKGKHYMRCSADVPVNFDWTNAVVQLKLDGTYCELGEFGFRTRSGNIYPVDLFTVPQFDGILMGELVVHDSRGHPLPRKTSNGIMNSILKGGRDAAGLDIRFTVWDWKADDSSKCDMPYQHRIYKLAAIASKSPHIHTISSVRVKSINEARQLAANAIAAGQEGMVLKTLTHKWKAGTSKECIKIKAERECELVVTGFNPGNGRNADTFGSMQCVSACGKVNVAVSGFTDDERARIWAEHEDLIDSIVTVRYNEIIDSNGQFSLFLPRFIEFRNDKTEADSLHLKGEIYTLK